jgi:hypothetical protein
MILHDVFDALNDFYELKISKYRFGSIEQIRLNSIEFDSVRYTRKVLEFYCEIFLAGEKHFLVIFGLLKPLLVLLFHLTNRMCNSYWMYF